METKRPDPAPMLGHLAAVATAAFGLTADDIVRTPTSKKFSSIRLAARQVFTYVAASHCHYTHDAIAGFLRFQKTVVYDDVQTVGLLMDRSPDWEAAIEEAGAAMLKLHRLRSMIAPGVLPAEAIAGAVA